MNRSLRSTTALAMALGLLSTPAIAGMEEAMEFLDNEINGMSTLSREEQEAEMQFFVDAAEAFQGMDINVVLSLIHI